MEGVLWMCFPASIVAEAHRFFLSHVEREHATAKFLEPRHSAIDTLDPGVSMRFLATFIQLAIGWQAATEGMQRLIHRALGQPAAFDP